MAGEQLPTKYWEETDKFKTSYKKEYADAKKDGRVEENDAEPIIADLFHLMYQWALEENNVYAWVFGLLQ